jgi:hypothetical protein
MMQLLLHPIDKLAAMTSTRRVRQERAVFESRHGDPETRAARDARYHAVAAEMRKLAAKIESDLG